MNFRIWIILICALLLPAAAPALDATEAQRILRARSPQEALGVDRGATEAEIKRAHRRIAGLFHLEADRGDKLATVVMQQVNTAKDFLVKKIPEGERALPRSWAPYRGPFLKPEQARREPPPRAAASQSAGPKYQRYQWQEFKEEPRRESPRQEAPKQEERKQEAPKQEPPRQEAPKPEKPKQQSVSRVPEAGPAEARVSPAAAAACARAYGAFAPKPKPSVDIHI